MEDFYKIILESELKVNELRGKLKPFDGVKSLDKLSADQAAVIAQVSISLYFLMDKFPMIVLEELTTEELERVNALQDEISSLQARIMELVRKLETAEKN